MGTGRAQCTDKANKTAAGFALTGHANDTDPPPRTYHLSPSPHCLGSFVPYVQGSLSGQRPGRFLDLTPFSALWSKTCLAHSLPCGLSRLNSRQATLPTGPYAQIHARAPSLAKRRLCLAARIKGLGAGTHQNSWGWLKAMSEGHEAIKSRTTQGFQRSRSAAAPAVPRVVDLL